MSKQHNTRNENVAVRVFIYARAASSENIEENQSLQLQELINYCHKCGYIKSNVFVDRGVSGRTPLTSRPAAKEMLEELPKYAVDAIVVSDVSRISRNPVDYFGFRKEMRNEGVSVIVVNQNFSKQLVSREEMKLAFDGFNERQEGCIGYFRGDFGNGEQFYSSFLDCHKGLKTPDFKGEFDDLIDYFRERGENPLLGSRDDMSKHIYSENQYLINYGEYADFCFKVVTEQHTYYFACSPREGDYNFRITCYKKI